LVLAGHRTTSVAPFRVPMVVFGFRIMLRENMAENRSEEQGRCHFSVGVQLGVSRTTAGTWGVWRGGLFTACSD
jgi:hypothetical protein